MRADRLPACTALPLSNAVTEIARKTSPRRPRPRGWRRSRGRAGSRPLPPPTQTAARPGVHGWLTRNLQRSLSIGLGGDPDVVLLMLQVCPAGVRRSTGRDRGGQPAALGPGGRAGGGLHHIPQRRQRLLPPRVSVRPQSGFTQICRVEHVLTCSGRPRSPCARTEGNGCRRPGPISFGYLYSLPPRPARIRARALIEIASASIRAITRRRRELAVKHMCVWIWSLLTRPSPGGRR